MPFRKRARIEFVNEGDKECRQYFYIDYETYADERALGPDPAYLHADFRMEHPFGGWGPDLWPNSPEVDGIVLKGRDAWDQNYVLTNVKGRGHYIGCFFSVVNLQAKSFRAMSDPSYSWWGEGDEMIWVDGYSWPPDLHGTGSEDYFNQAMGMQRNAYLRNGTAVHEFDTEGFSTSYVFHVENPVRFQKELRATIEIGHANHLGNDISSVAFFYLDRLAGSNRIGRVLSPGPPSRADFFPDSPPRDLSFRYAPGLLPVSFLNRFEKCSGSIPQAQATSFIRRSVSVISRLA